MHGGLTLGRVFGIPVTVHHTWLIAFFLVAWSLAGGFFPAAYPGWSPGLYWLTGALAAVLLFVSVLVHELSHALVARSRGLAVRGITLFVFGGVAAIEAEAETPRDEFAVAVVGPLASAAIAALARLASVALGPDLGPAGAILAYLAVANALLAGFNLLPGLPLDGGRVLRALVWAASGSLRTGTNVSSYVGQAVAFGLIGWGAVRILDGDLLGGTWTAFIGWFLNGAAETSRRQLAMAARFRDVRVADLMSPEPRALAPATPLEVFVHEEAIRRGHRALPVVADGRLVGIVSVTDAQRAPPDAWATTPVSAVMTRAELAVVGPADDLDRALKLMADRGLHQLLVTRDGQLVGLLTRASVIQFLALHAGRT